MIKTFNVETKNYRYDEVDSVETLRFATPEIRDKWFEIIRTSYSKSNNFELEISEENKFSFNDKGKWLYHYEKTEEEIEIITDFTMDDDKGIIKEFIYQK